MRQQLFISLSAFISAIALAACTPQKNVETKVASTPVGVAPPPESHEPASPLWKPLAKPPMSSQFASHALRLADAWVLWDRGGFRWFLSDGNAPRVRQDPDPPWESVASDGTTIVAATETSVYRITDPMATPVEMAELSHGADAASLECAGGGCTLQTDRGVLYTTDLRNFRSVASLGSDRPYRAVITKQGRGLAELVYGALARTEDAGRNWTRLQQPDPYWMAQQNAEVRQVTALRDAPAIRVTLPERRDASRWYTLNQDGITADPPKYETKPGKGEWFRAPRFGEFVRAIKEDPFHDLTFQQVNSLTEHQLERGSLLHEERPAPARCNARTLKREAVKTLPLALQSALPKLNSFTTLHFYGERHAFVVSQDYLPNAQGGVRKDTTLALVEDGGKYVPLFTLSGQPILIAGACDRPVGFVLDEAEGSPSPTLTSFEGDRVGVARKVDSWVRAYALVAASPDELFFAGSVACPNGDANCPNSSRFGHLSREHGWRSAPVPMQHHGSAWLQTLTESGRGLLFDEKNIAWITLDRGATWQSIGGLPGWQPDGVLCTKAGCEVGQCAHFTDWQRAEQAARELGRAAPKPPAKKEEDVWGSPKRGYTCSASGDPLRVEKVTKLFAGEAGNMELLSYDVPPPGLEEWEMRKERVTATVTQLDNNGATLGSYATKVRLSESPMSNPVVLHGRNATLLHANDRLNVAYSSPAVTFSTEREGELLDAYGWLDTPNGVIASFYGVFDWTASTGKSGTGTLPVQSYLPCVERGGPITSERMAYCGVAAPLDSRDWVGVSAAFGTIRWWRWHRDELMVRSATSDALGVALIPKDGATATILTIEERDERLVVEARELELEATFSLGQARLVQEIPSIDRLPACKAANDGTLLRYWEQGYVAVRGVGEEKTDTVVGHLLGVGPSGVCLHNTFVTDSVVDAALVLPPGARSGFALHNSRVRAVSCRMEELP